MQEKRSFGVEIEGEGVGYVEGRANIFVGRTGVSCTPRS